MSQGSDEQRPPARERPRPARREPEPPADLDDDAWTDDDARAPDTAPSEES
ncbi:hypothetical protein [Micromonospora costi]|uniref:hypothetical protein n=1 Tax=Micromonospora costi TaxID=1530042 RepID=UPI00131A0F79|nr:hypothetical protein [Micromonospora costi]